MLFLHVDPIEFHFTYSIHNPALCLESCLLQSFKNENTSEWHGHESKSGEQDDFVVCLGCSCFLCSSQSSSVQTSRHLSRGPLAENKVSIIFFSYKPAR